MAKSLMANMIKNRNAKVKAEAQKNKKMVAKNKVVVQQNQPTEEILEEKAVMKESKTLMID